MWRLADEMLLCNKKIILCSLMFWFIGNVIHSAPTLKAAADNSITWRICNGEMLKASCIWLYCCLHSVCSLWMTLNLDTKSQWQYVFFMYFMLSTMNHLSDAFVCFNIFCLSYSTAAAFQQGKIPPTPFPGGPPPGESVISDPFELKSKIFPNNTWCCILFFF